MRPVYIVLSTRSVGGAEKRFAEIWCALLQQGKNVHLVLDQRAHAALVQRHEYENKIGDHANLHLLDFGGPGYKEYAQAIWRFFRTQPTGGVVHYPLAYVPGVQKYFGHRLVVSWVNSALPPFAPRAFKNGAMAWASFVAADRIDVLNPDNLRDIQRIRLFRAKASLTEGGTHVDSQMYRPLIKGLDLVYLSRFEPGKQVMRLVRALPEVHRQLQARNVHGCRFLLCGDGTEAAQLRATLQESGYRDLPITLQYSKDPETVLGRAAVFFSLQKRTNYPSKALAEAMACGAFPILTDTGETRLMVDGCSHYALVPGDFSASDIADALIGFLTRPSAERARIASELAHYAGHRFAIGKQASYFAQLYDEVTVV